MQTNRMNRLFLKEPEWDTPGNHVASPFGAWILLAILVGGNTKALTAEERAKLEDILGEPVESAYSAAKRLLSNVPEEVSLAVKGWVRDLLKPEVGVWLSDLQNDGIDAGLGMPTQDAADQWAADNTKNLIKKFPADVENPDLAVLLASAVATKIKWAKPYNLVVNNSGAWDGVQRLLHENKTNAFLFYVDDELWAAHKKVSADGGITTIAILPPDGAERNLVQDVAYELSGDLLLGNNAIPLEVLGEGDYGVATIVKQRGFSSDDTYNVTLPAWDAESNFDLIDGVDVGFVDAAGVLGRYEGDAYNATQSAVASYDKEGFEAAAVTQFGLMRASSVMLPSSIALEASIIFDRPFAVIALSTDLSNEDWFGQTLFTAWVAEAKESE